MYKRSLCHKNESIKENQFFSLIISSSPKFKTTLNLSLKKKTDVITNPQLLKNSSLFLDKKLNSTKEPVKTVRRNGFIKY